jgi:hypothetical protein
MKWRAYIWIFCLAAVLSSCTFHHNFPFICFRRSCVNNQLDLKSFKKRVAGKLVAMQRKRNKKPAAKAGQVVRPDKDRSGPGEDSVAATKGTNVDYYRYLLFFRLKSDPRRLDSLVIEHTSQYKTIIKTDQVRLRYLLDTLSVKNIMAVYIRKYYDVKREEQDHQHVAKGRNRSICKFLKHCGIPPQKIKLLQDSLSPPRL